MSSPSFSFAGFDFKVLLEKNWNKLDTYVKVTIALIVGYFISNDVIVQIIAVPVTKIILDILHYYIFEVKQSSVATTEKYIEISEEHDVPKINK